MQTAIRRRDLPSENLVRGPARSRAAVAAIESVSLSGRVLDHLQIAVAAVDGNGHVRLSNVVMRNLAAAGDSVGIAPSGRLYFLHPETEAAFRDALRGRPAAAPDAAATVPVKNRDGTLCHVASLVPLGSDFDCAGTMLLTFGDTAAAPRAQTAHLMRAFGLTPAEQRLAGFLLEGGSLSEAARSFALSRHTVRNQLRSTFAKAGVRRQADLTRRLMGWAVAEE